MCEFYEFNISFGWNVKVFFWIHFDLQWILFCSRWGILTDKLELLMWHNQPPTLIPSHCTSGLLNTLPFSILLCQTSRHHLLLVHIIPHTIHISSPLSRSINIHRSFCHFRVTLLITCPLKSRTHSLIIINCWFLICNLLVPRFSINRLTS